MIYTTLKSLIEELNHHFKSESKQGPSELFVLQKATNSSNKNLKNKIGVTLVNIQEDAFTSKNPVSFQTNSNPVSQNFQRALKLSVLFIPDFENYEEGLIFIDELLEFFQKKPIFNSNSNPEEGRILNQFRVQFCSLSLEQNYQLWTSLGIANCSSALFEIRVV